MTQAGAAEDLVARRRRLLGPNVSTFYDQPVHITRGEGVWVWDADGNRYLDCYNNVPHVGHCHPTVVNAICGQAATLNVHSRYLHAGLPDYIERLTGTFADGLDTAVLTCTGSEANDIALRMAWTVTGKRGIIATDHTYHGNTSAVAQLSATNRPGTGAVDWVAHVPAPDSYRPLGGVPGKPHAEAFAAAVQEAIAVLEARGVGFAGIILCPGFVNEGFPELEPGWLAPALAAVREAGGLFIADEVQSGFGRLGHGMWAHERIGARPDIVTLGKPMGNGHPVAGLVTRPEIMAAFRESYRYFNTFGGNPVSVAAANAMLDVLEGEELIENARRVGDHARDGLRALAERYDWIGDVRGSGLIFGAEIVTDRETKTPATGYVKRVVNEMRHRGVLMNFLGIHYNTLKIRPPMPFSTENADHMLDRLDDVLATLGRPVD